jgi:hypothetical protein
MFSKLSVEVDGTEIEFTASELIQLAQELLDALPGEEILVPEQGWFDAIMRTVAPQMNYGAILAGRLDPFIVLPIHLTGMNNPQKWLYVVKALATDYEDNPLQGWWAKIGKRLVLVQNTEDYRFYVADHGNVHEIYDNTWELAFNSVDWTHPGMISAIVQIELEFRKMSAAEREELNQKLLELSKATPVAELREFHPGMKDEEILKLQAQLDDAAYVKNQRAFFEENHRYVLNILIKELGKHLSLVSNVYADCGVLDEEGEVIEYDDEKEALKRHEDATRIIKALILLSVARGVNTGKQESLCRPIYAFGSRERGEAYRSFYDALIECLKTQDSVELVRAVRMLLRGESYVDVPDFLPSLVGALYLAEGSRNHLSLLTTTMMLDLMESGVSLEIEGKNIYDWPHVLVHPSEVALQKDGRYPNKKGGTLTMCHRGAVDDAKTPLTPGSVLNRLRKKEARLIIHWLLEFMNKNYPHLKAQVEKVEEGAEVKVVASPIEALEKKITKLKKDIAFKTKGGKDATKDIQELEQLVTKLEKKKKARAMIVNILQERLVTFANLLGVSLKVSPLAINLACRKEREIFQTKQNVKFAFPDYLSISDCGAGGDCLFRSVAYQTSDTGETPEELRQLLKAALESNKAMLRNMIEPEGADVRLIRADGEEEYIVEADRYIELMGMPGTWGGQIELAVLAGVLNRPIALIAPGYRPMVYPSGVDVAGHPLYEGIPIFIYYNGHNHYQMLAVRADSEMDEFSAFRAILFQSLTDDLPHPAELVDPSRSLLFYRRLHEEYITEHRHEDPMLQEEYDRRFGLVLR